MTTFHTLAYGFLSVVFLAMGVLYSRAYRKREIMASRLHAGASLSISGFMLFLFAAVDPIYSYSSIAMAIWISSFWAFEVCTLAFSIHEMSLLGSEGQRKGDLVPTAQVALAVLLFGIAPYIGYQSVVSQAPSSPPVLESVEFKAIDETSQSRTRIFKEVNLSYTIPEGSWVEYDASQMNPPALIAMYQADPVAYFYMMAQTGALVEKEKEAAWFQTGYADFTKKWDNNVIKQGTSEIMGIKGYYFESEHHMPNYAPKVRHIHWMGLKNGFFYQFSAYTSLDTSFDELNKIFKEHTQGLALLESDRISTPESPKEDFRSRRYPYLVHLKESGWSPWWGQDDVPGAELLDCKFALGASSSFMVYPILFREAAPPAEILTKAFLKMHFIEYDQLPPASIRPIKENGYDGFAVDAEGELSGEKFDFRIKVLRGKNLAFYVVACASKMISGGDVEGLERGRKMFEPLKEEGLPEFKSQNANEKKRHQIAYGWIGKTYYLGGDKNKALYFYKEAHTLSPDDKDLLMSIMVAYDELKLPLEGFRYAEKFMDTFKNDPEMKRKFADLASKVGEWKKAKDIYEQLIRDGHIDDYLLEDYLDMMKKKGSEKDAYKELKALASSGSIEVRSSIASLLEDNDQDEESFKIMKDLYQKQPRDGRISGAYYYHLLKSGRFQEAAESADKHIKDYGEAANIYFYQGHALTALNQYEMAMAAFMRSKELDPEPEGLENYIEGLSQMIERKPAEPVIHSAEIHRDIHPQGKQLKIEETVKFYGATALHLKSVLKDLSAERMKDHIRSLWNPYHGQFEIVNISTSDLPQDVYELKVSYNTLSSFENAGSKYLIHLPQYWEEFVLWPEEDDLYGLPLSIIFPLSVYSETTLHYSADFDPEIGESAVNALPSGCVQVKTDLHRDPKAFKVKNTYVLTGGSFSDKQIDQCRGNVTDALKQGVPAILVNKGKE